MAALARPNLSESNDIRAKFFTEINPIGKIPAIEHDGKIITETAAICVYLAQVFPDAGLAPTQQELADYYRWIFFAAGPVEQAVTNHRAGFTPLPEQEFFFGSYFLKNQVSGMSTRCAHDFSLWLAPSASW